MSYKYDQSTVQLLDQILFFLNKDLGEKIGEKGIESELFGKGTRNRRQFQRLISCLGTLEREGLIETYGTGNNLYRITPAGQAFLGNGGFKQNHQDHIEELEENERLKRRIRKIEKEQSEFYRSSIQRNKVQTTGIIISLVLSIVAIFISIFK